MRKWRAGRRSPAFERRTSPGTPLVAALVYFVVAAVGIVVPASAQAVGDGQIWLLLTSALAAQGPLPLVQVALAAACAALVIDRLGALAWWRAALAGHIGSALIVYALILLAGARSAATASDYGVSCVLGASLGALLTLRERPATLIGVAGTLALLPLSLSWLGLEHPLAVVLGAAVSARAAAAARTPRRPRTAARPRGGPRRPAR